MKKTLATILALGSTAFAGTDFVFDYTSYNTGATPAISSPQVTGNASFVRATMEGAGYDKNTNSTPAWNGVYQTNNKYGGSALSPAIDITHGGSWTYTLTFTVGQAMTTDSVSFAVLSFNSEGNWGAPYGSDRTGPQSFTLTGPDDSTLVSTQTQTVTYLGYNNSNYTGTSNPQQFKVDIDTEDDAASLLSIEDGCGAISTFTFDTPVTLQAGIEYKLTFTVNQGDSTQANMGLGLGVIAFNAVPEPATATLSLLALAGLAARRRRK